MDSLGSGLNCEACALVYSTPGDRLLRYVMLIGGEQRQRDPHSRRPLRICR